MHFGHFLLDPDLIFGFPCRHTLYHLLVFCYHEVQGPFFTVPLPKVLGVVLHGKSHKKSVRSFLLANIYFWKGTSYKKHPVYM